MCFNANCISKVMLVVTFDNLSQVCIRSKLVIPGFWKLLLQSQCVCLSLSVGCLSVCVSKAINRWPF